MKKQLLAALALCTGLAAIPGGAILADSMSSMSSMPMEATMMCRPAMAKEKPNAMMGSHGLMCKMMGKMDPKMMGPDVKGMDAAAEDAAWHKWISQMMAIPFGGGAGG